MRIRSAVALSVLLVLAQAQPVLAWDPFANERDDAPAPVPADPAPLIAPPGLYLVTDVYTGNAVTTSGNTTTYTTTTTPETPGTYARVLDDVATGVASAYDGASFNGRARLPDGRAVAGTYYEDYVLTADGYLSVNIVFFQDDSITVIVPAASAAPLATSTPPTRSAASPAPTRAATPSWPPVPTPAPIPLPVATPRPLTATAAIALAETGPVLTSIELLRGRRVALWPRAFVDGAAVPVRSWRLVSGYADVASPQDGDAWTPCVASWLSLAPAGSAWTLRFEVTTDAAPGRVLTATISVLVRSPALEQ